MKQTNKHQIKGKIFLHLGKVSLNVRTKKFYQQKGTKTKHDLLS